MQLIVNSRRFDDPPFLASGGIGKIYKLDKGVAAKVFHLDKREFERRQKVFAFCNSFQNHVSQIGTAQYAFPEYPAYEFNETIDSLVGFSMRLFGDIPEMGSLGFNFQAGAYLESKGVTLDDTSAIGFVYQVFELVDKLHRARIVLGDVNNRNVLYNPDSGRALVIDIDSAQIGQFPCTEVTEDFMAPELKNRGTNLAGGYIFDTGTDIFALAAISFEFLIGLNPNFLHTVPMKELLENRATGVSSIRCFMEGSGYLSALGLSYMNVPENKAIEERLSWLQREDRQLFDFFVSVFVKNERSNVLSELPVNDPRHPGYHFFTTSGFGDVIAKLEKERAGAILAASGSRAVVGQTSSIPDSGFRSVFANFGVAPVPLVAPAKQTVSPLRKSDPPQLAAFLRQFNLTY